ncbi:MAG TPA: beta-ribofuranosylaminobenzene 5'-phosphate synthase family protein [Methylomirabilota bacterium]|jgi:beta-RFAP synthase|nr:beta-ribofuranosylaminobenzene 5'-phosphate synthase family protein [Methylomirabilota bacterium]
MRTIVVDAGARLHLGFLDLNGDCGRRYGSIGVALERPRCTVEAAPAPPGAAPAPGDPAGVILTRLGLASEGIAVRLVEALPVHAGFGAGTQHALAVALAAVRAAGRAVPARELARRLGRGQRSGIGVATFEHGGLVIDAGHPAQDDVDAPPGETGGPEPPPVIFRHPLPGDWHFVLATPRAAPGLSGPSEQRAFRDLPPMDAERVGRICRLTLIQLAPAVLAGDIRTFGEAVTGIQEVVGEYFAPYQGGGRFASQTGCDVTEFARARGAHGVGQSSWGPTVFALMRGEAAARALAGSVRAAFGDSLAWVDASPARNRGASWREAP